MFKASLYSGSSFDAELVERHLVAQPTDPAIVFQSTHPHGVRQALGRLANKELRVSIHAPARGATKMKLSILEEKWFQSTHPHGVRLFCRIYTKLSGVFQSTHPHGVRLSPALSNIIIDGFQSTHPHGVRLSKPYKPQPYNGFNPRTRTGCDEYFYDIPRYMIVSIHAPARGSTDIVVVGSTRVMVSIHAPARGATDVQKLRLNESEFQSTHPHGVRLKTGGRDSSNLIVSIHAPARGATGGPELMCDNIVFQSTHPHGVRPRGGIFPHVISLFQSTHPHGVRRAVVELDKLRIKFQSTHPHGVRLYSV